MTSCLAVTNAYRLCGNYSTVSKDSQGYFTRDFTCRKHATFFDNSREIKKKWFNLNEGGYARYMHMTPWIRKWIESCLQGGLVKMTKENIESIVHEDNERKISPRWAYFILLCAYHTKDFSYSWNPQLWEACVKQLWYWSESVGPVYITKKDLQLLLCVKGGIYEFYKGISIAPSYITEEEWQIFFDNSCQGNPEWFEHFILTPIEDHLSPVSVLNVNKFTEQILEKKKFFLEKYKKRCSIIKEEVIAVAYHPSRFKDWTLTHKENQELNKRWNNPSILPFSLQTVLEEVCRFYVSA